VRILVVVDVFPPFHSSAAVQMGDLTRELVLCGNQVSVLVPRFGIREKWGVDDYCGVRVVHLRSKPIKDIGYIRRVINEFLTPFDMWRGFKKTTIFNESWDAVIWYSPSIFFGPLIKRLKRKYSCRSYLILRDVFPECWVDINLISRAGAAYKFFKLVELFQYSLADTIGIQTASDLPYFEGKTHKNRVEVLSNWLAEMPNAGCSISVEDTRLAGRSIFVYAGNMGAMHDIHALLNLADRMKSRRDIGFLFVGRGSQSRSLRDSAAKMDLDNVEFFDAVDSSEIPGLYAQCHIGLVALDHRHKSHNIPGKFLSYMRCGLPVLAQLNPGNDLVRIIEDERVGRSNSEASTTMLHEQAEKLILEVDAEMRLRCKKLAVRMFSPRTAVDQILRRLSS